MPPSQPLYWGYVDGPDWRSEREFIVETVGAIERAIRKGGPTP